MYSSFSKTLAPGIRLGWLYAGDLYSKAERVKFSLGRSVSPVYQELILKLLQSSSYERHLRTFRRKLNDQAVQLSGVLENIFPPVHVFISRKEGIASGHNYRKRQIWSCFISIAKNTASCLLPGRPSLFQAHTVIISGLFFQKELRQKVYCCWKVQEKSKRTALVRHSLKMRYFTSLIAYFRFLVLSISSCGIASMFLNSKPSIHFSLVRSISSPEMICF